MFQVHLRQEGEEIEVDREPRQWQVLLLRGDSLPSWAGGSQAHDQQQLLPGNKHDRHHYHQFYINSQVILQCSSGLTMQVQVQDLCQTPCTTLAPATLAPVIEGLIVKV